MSEQVNDNSKGRNTGMHAYPFYLTGFAHTLYNSYFPNAVQWSALKRSRSTGFMLNSF